VAGADADDEAPPTARDDLGAIDEAPVRA
jgi:hypothetical protein